MNEGHTKGTEVRDQGTTKRGKKECWYLELPEIKKKELHNRKAELLVMRASLWRNVIHSINLKAEELMFQMDSKNKVAGDEDTTVELSVSEER